MLLTVIMAQAQTKISMKLENGFKAVYTEAITANMAGEEMTATTETEYVVSDVTPEGAIITITQKKADYDSNDDLSAKLSVLADAVLQGVEVKVRTDADGKITGIVNIDEVKSRAMTTCDNLIAVIKKEMTPEMEQMLPIDALKKQVEERMTEESFINVYNNTGIFALNGKTISNGATESFTNNGLKMKRMFFLAGKNIIANSSLDMTKDEMKAFLIKQVEAIAPAQAEMVKENIDMLMGQMKFEAKEKSTYELQDNGWAKSIKTETTQEIMGQSVNQTAIVTLK